MAHAVPTRGTATQAPTGAPGGPGTRDRTTTPDVFGPRAHRMAKWAVPVGIGLVYGYWAASISRRGGPITGWNVLFGFLTVLAFVVLFAVVRAVAERLPREGHAALWAAFAGCALGFLYSRSGVAVFTSVVVSLLLAAAVFASLFYRYYTHEDAQGHRRVD
ncbi:Integral membrane protein [Streptomyces ambofaciens ATCC 23877]|uniref:Integral membrane protein n=2 Tax=Streptomyces ambofaciens TaxID=1889 RepID=A0A0K2AVI2_STRA7|nr:hypothetical protein [Streptomyces ambofaciens]AKZ56916.1 Integral membrane protein [Streptomyces ambofaciens ATCC 23877]ANB07475.1 hypothetical protein SAM40697_3517 [Streptomyces ambofaciens]